MVKMGFTYDPLEITRLLLRIHMDKHLEKELDVDATRFACYKFLDDITDSELEQILREYVERHSVKEITFKDAEDECGKIFVIIFESDKFVELETEYKVKGHGVTGLGVYDRQAKVFYDCSFTNHWPTVRTIIETAYPHLFEPFVEFSYGYTNKEEINGVTREYLDKFILDNFQLVGANNSIDSYLS